MASTYSARKAALNEIAARITTNQQRLTQARALILQAETDLAAMQTFYNGFVADINADAAAAPGDSVFVVMKGEKDKMVSEFLAMKTRATALKTAYDSVLP